MEAPVSVQAHRREHNPSKLPYRKRERGPIDAQTALAITPISGREASTIRARSNVIKVEQHHEPPALAVDVVDAGSLVSSSSHNLNPNPNPTSAGVNTCTSAPENTSQQHQHALRFTARNASKRRNAGHHPEIMSNQDHQDHQDHHHHHTQLNTENHTNAWVETQGALNNNSASTTAVESDRRGQLSLTLQLPPLHSHSNTSDSASSPLSPSPQPRTPVIAIPPIRAFKTSRKSVEAANSNANTISMRPAVMDQDDTLRALDGFNMQRASNRDQEEQSSDESDLFLKLAREENAVISPRTGPIRRSQINSNRQSLPPNHSVFQNSSLLRRGSNQETGAERQGDARMSQALTYRPSTRERIPNALDTSRQRYGGNSTPTTPRASTSREDSPPESQVSYGGRRPSIPDQNGPSRTSSYRQSNLSYSAPRTYHSSPLVSRTTDGGHDAHDVARGVEGTESTVSTTAPSTVWDELEDLKSRIHRLELTGKLPPSSGAAISRASNERPPTATTTATTMSASPKRGAGKSLSPTEALDGDIQSSDTHPLLTSSLAKSKALLSPEVYSTLQATATDALAIVSMMGPAGQPGPISSSQSTIGGGSSMASDRQVRRKADSLCRSLTELCLALSEGKTEQAPQNGTVSRPRSRDTEMESIVENAPRQPVSSDLVRLKSSVDGPRALSRLEARRSSLLATSTLPSPRYAPSEAGTPTQSSMAGRRTSMLLRSRRGGTEEPEEDDESRFRAPSRATTEIGRLGNSPRDVQTQQLVPERVQPILSSLPVRRHYASTSLGNTAPPVAMSNGSARRYLDRTTPERETAGPPSRLAVERQRKSSIGQGFLSLGRTGSLTRRTREPNMGDQ